MTSKNNLNYHSDDPSVDEESGSANSPSINPVDYSALGLKVGLEIHQQLDTPKLFCSCPSSIRDDTPDNVIRRRLRASAGETGVVDVAAAYEMEKQKHFVYEFYNDSNCLVELDESPPEPMNNNALSVVLQLSMMMNCNVVDQVNVMRKTVVDGSNTSGFQRTALVARNGFIDVENSDRPESVFRLGIETVCIEEDAARIISKNPDHDIYRLDRLGIPLIEIATCPDIKTPKQAKDAAAFIGMMLRSTGSVKRGLGTIRQDVNVSIASGVRVEIKGVQDLKMIDKVVELEVERQLRMLRLIGEMKDRGIASSIITGSIIDVSEKFLNSKCGFIKKGIASGLGLYAKSYRNFKGFFGFELNPNRRLGSELSDRIRLLGLNGLIHTDEDMGKYGIIEEIGTLYSDFNLEGSDSIILILGTKNKCKLAFEKIDSALKELLDKGLSKEVRNAKDDGTSSYLRPMPTGSRMYPETDIPLIYPDTAHIKMPELIRDKIARFEKEYTLPKQVAKDLVFERDFEVFVNKYPQVKPILIAESLVSMPKDIKARYGLEINTGSDLFNSQLNQILQKLNEGAIPKEAVFEILLGIAKGEHGKDIDFSKYSTSEDEIISFIVKIISERPGHNANAIMGEVMKKYRGKYPGQKILELIRKYKGE